MRKTTLLFVFTMLVHFLFAQWNKDTTWHIIKFDSTYKYLKQDTSARDIWEIGKPSKTFFDSAWSKPNAIVTDTNDNYPANNHSWFDLYLTSDNIIEYYLSAYISIKHKYDTDTLQDGCYITVSYDHGATWRNIIHDTIGMNNAFHIPNQDNHHVSNLYTDTNSLAGQKYGFSGNSGGWVTTQFGWQYAVAANKSNPYDTMIVRFHFISDSIDNPKEGWMIDNIRLHTIRPTGIQTEEQPGFQLYPNPTSGIVNIKLDKLRQNIRLRLLTTTGQLIEQRQYENRQEIRYERNDLSPGLYLLELKTGDQPGVTKKLLVK
ncbi:MAG: T9SS type A sorting domain-containing protein [Bacteroidales bacterium]|nr:T9SS type A sorting domain-containing protein [Bacteroidales bacterium]MCF8328559.1 T9SS type A sorting domain-containing protein [Bacteroidales bacterium]